MDYNIFWIDDKHEEMQGFKDRAKNNGIILHPFKSEKSGLTNLKKNFEKYDGILLDVKFIPTDNSKESPHSKHAVNAERDIKSLKKKFKVVFLSGEEDTFSDDGVKVYLEGPVFSKFAETKPLFEKLKEFANEQPEFQLKLDYPEGFSVCSEEYIGNKAGDILLKILKNKEDYSMNYVRKILEALFKKYEKLELIPSSLDFAQTSRFLSGDIENNFQLNESSRLPVPISETLRCIIRTVNPGSHYTTDEELKKDVDKYLNNKYSKKAIVLLLMDVLIDFKRQIDSSPVRKNWIEKFKDIGIIKAINNGFGFIKLKSTEDLFFHSKKCVSFNDLVEGDKVEFNVIEGRKGQEAINVTKL